MACTEWCGVASWNGWLTGRNVTAERGRNDRGTAERTGSGPCRWVSALHQRIMAIAAERRLRFTAGWAPDGPVEFGGLCLFGLNKAHSVC